MGYYGDMKRAGLYYWAGPGTIRMTHLKYPWDRVDEKSFMGAYDLDVLTDLKEKFKLTDVFVTYSWGFGEDVEQEDYEFIVERLDNFKELGLRVHGYVQGLNLVYEDYSDKEYFCRDGFGRLIPYQRGRMMTCPNNSEFKKYFLKKIEKAIEVGFDGIYVDNVNYGMFPIPVGGKKLVGWGCKCDYCTSRFNEMFGYKMPRTVEINSREYGDMIKMRRLVMKDFLEEVSLLVRKAGLEFGSNSFDPKYDTVEAYGYDLDVNNKLQDYLLFENYDIPARGKNNFHLRNFFEKYKKSFVVSYLDGIGRDGQFGQEVFDKIFTESEELGYWPCYKGTEYIDNGVWKVIEKDRVGKVKKIGIGRDAKKSIQRKLPFEWLAWVYEWSIPVLMRIYFENKVVRKLGDQIYFGVLA